MGRQDGALVRLCEATKQTTTGLCSSEEISWAGAGAIGQWVAGRWGNVGPWYHRSLAISSLIVLPLII